MLIVSLLVFLLLSTQGMGQNQPNAKLAIQWPIGACINRYRNSGKQRQDCIQRNNESGWTIHGLWEEPPNQIKDQHPEVNLELNDMQARLIEMWPNVLTPDNKWLWQHEYNKHGINFVGKVNGIIGPRDYFRLALSLFEGIPFNRNKSIGNCQPRGNAYQFQELNACITAQGIKQEFYEFARYNVNGAYILYELRICYRINDINDFQMVPCTGGDINLDNCGIYYPEHDIGKKRRRRSTENDTCPLFFSKENNSTDYSFSNSATAADVRYTIYVLVFTSVAVITALWKRI